MNDNWIERDHQREQNLKNTEDLWQSVVTAIDDTCKNFNRLKSHIGNAELIPMNGHSVRVDISHEANKNQRMDMKRRARIVFDGKSITVTVDEHKTNVCAIDADQKHCFLKAFGKEITPDEFAQLALKDALFTPRIPEEPGSPPPKTGVWS